MRAGRHAFETRVTMAFSGMGSNGARGRGRWRNSTSLAEMNVVPLVDVMLVLLIIFMVTASAMEFGLEIQVPKVKSASHSVQDAPVVSISRDGKTYLRERPTNVNQLSAAIKQQFRDAKDVYVKSDKNVRVEQLFQVLAVLGHLEPRVRVGRHDHVRRIARVDALQRVGHVPAPFCSTSPAVLLAHRPSLLHTVPDGLDDGNRANGSESETHFACSAKLRCGIQLGAHDTCRPPRTSHILRR